MANSQNGWPVVGREKIIDKEVLGVEFPNGWLEGDVDVIFTELIKDLNKIEKIDDGGCWGWFVKNIEGSKSISNHASGTAIDYNAPNHPMGVRNTYSANKRSLIRSLLRNKYENVIRWGGDYSGRPDDMHFEIVGSVSSVKRVAQKLRPTPPRKVTYMRFEVNVPAIRQGDSDSDLDGYNHIVRIQRIVGAKADGDWGPLTTAAIAKWCKMDASKCKAMNEELYRKIYGLGK